MDNTFNPPEKIPQAKPNKWKRMGAFLIEKTIEFSLFGGLFFLITNNVQRSYTDYTIDLANASEFFSNFTELANQRLYRTNKLHWMYIDQDSILDNDYHQMRLEKYRNEYLDVLDDWNSKLSQNSLLFEMRFGEPFKVRFEEDIHKGFIKLHHQLNMISDLYQRNGRVMDDKLISSFKAEFEYFANEVLTPFYLDMKLAIDKAEIGRNKKP